MKNWAVILVLLLGWANVIFAANESINVDSLNGRVKETYSGVGAPIKPFDFSLVSVTGLPGGGGGGGVSITAASPIIVTPNPILTTGTISLNATSKANWDAAFTERRQWDGGATNLDAVLGRASLALGTAAQFDASAFQPMTTFRFSIIESLEGNVVNLAGDQLTPGISKYYGTDAGGSKGWFTLPTPGGGGVPGGSSGQAQYNNAGAFGGISSLTTSDGNTVLQQTGSFYRLTDPTLGGQIQFDLSSIPSALLRTIKTPNADSVTVVPDAGAANNFLTGITTAGAITKAQPSFTNLSGDFALTQTPSAGVSRLIGRGSSGAGDWQEILLGTGLTMSGTTLNAGGGGGTAGGSNTQLQYNNAGAFGGVASALYTGSELLLDSSTTVHRDTTDVTKRFRFNMANVPTASTVDVVIPNSTNPVVVAPDIGASNNFLTGITTLGVITKAQPSFANVSGDFALTQTPQVASPSLIGRGTAGTGDWERILLGTGLSMSGTTLNSTPTGSFIVSDAATATIANPVALGHTTSATPVANFGTGLAFNADDSTTDLVPMGAIQTKWTNPVHGLNDSTMEFLVADFGAIPGIKASLNHNGIFDAIFGYTVGSAAPASGKILQSMEGVKFSASTATFPLTAGTSGNVLTSNGTNWISSAPGASGAPTDAAYITQTPVTGLSGEFALSSLATGLVKNTTATGVLSIGTPRIDYALPSQSTFSNAGSSGSPLAWSSSATVTQESAALNADRYALLPAANSFAPGTIITYIDTLTTANFGRNFRPQTGTDTLDGLTNANYVTAGTWLRPFIAGGMVIGQGVYQFKTDGTGNWISVYSAGRATKVQDSLDATKYVTFDVSGQASNAGFTVAPATGGNSVTVAPSNVGGAGQAVTGVTAAGDLAVTQILPDPTSLPNGQVLLVNNPDGATGVWQEGSVAQSITGWTQLDASPATIVWDPIDGQGQQNAYILAMGANKALTIASGGLQSGQTFNLIVQQDGTGGRVLTFTTATQFFSPSNGVGTIQQTLSANALDYYELKYTGTSAFPFIVSNVKLNLTSAAPPTCSTAGVSYATGTDNSNSPILQTSAQKYRAGNFIWTPTTGETNICRVDIPLMRVIGTTGPNYGLHAAIYADAVRPTGTHTTGVTTNGSNTITDASGDWSSNDRGQRITFSAGYGAGTYYIASVVSATSVTISTDKAGTTAANATSSQTNVTTVTFGVPGSIVDAGTGSTNSVSSSSLPTTTTDANASPTAFTGLTATGLISGATYHVVVWGDGAASATDYVRWIYDSNSTNRIGYSFRISSNGTGWQFSAAAKARYITYH